MATVFEYKLGEFAAAEFLSLASHSKAVAGGRVSELGVNININMNRGWQHKHWRRS